MNFGSTENGLSTIGTEVHKEFWRQIPNRVYTTAGAPKNMDGKSPALLYTK